MSFINKVLLVTGASSGIGAATAAKFVKEGAHVVMVSRNIERLKSVSNDCEKFGTKPHTIQADLRNEDHVKKIVEEVIKRFRRIDVLVNNAGILKLGSLLHGNILKAYDNTMQLNVRAQINLTCLVTPYLIKSKGSVVNISSIAGTAAPEKPATSAYHISKAALSHFTRCAAIELAKHGVRVNAVNPGPVRTELMENAGIKNTNIGDLAKYLPLQRISEPDEIADIIAFLASDMAKGITGSEFVVDNGYLIKRGP